MRNTTPGLLLSGLDTNYKRNAGLGCLSLGRKECQGISQGQAFIIAFPFLSFTQRLKEIKEETRVPTISFVLIFALRGAKISPINIGGTVSETEGTPGIYRPFLTRD
jgi:hypothetical protein